MSFVNLKEDPGKAPKLEDSEGICQKIVPCVCKNVLFSQRNNDSTNELMDVLIIVLLHGPTKHHAKGIGKSRPCVLCNNV